MKVCLPFCLLYTVTTVFGDFECPQPDNQPGDYYITYVSGKCWYLLKLTTGSFTSGTTSCKRSNGLDLAKIESQAENDFAQGVLSLWGIQDAFIGLQSKPGADWLWDDGSSLGFSNLVSGTPAPPADPGPSLAPTTKRTTAGPGNRRRPTSVVLLLDNSVYSTTQNTKNQLLFYKQLGQYITDRGDAEFAIYQYGCDTSTTSAYVEGYSGLLGLLNTTQSNVANQCTRIKSFAPNGIADVVDTFVSDYYASSPVFHKKNAYLSVLFFSTVNDASLITAAPAMSPIADEQVITIAVGKNAAQLNKFSIPSTNNIRINDFSDMSGLVQKVDGMIFSGVSGAQFMQEAPRFGAIDLAQFDAVKQNAIMNVTDGLWYPVPNQSSQKHAMLCTGRPTLSPSVNPTVPDPGICQDHFIYYQDLAGNFCFKTSEKPRNFSAAQSDCIDSTYKHPPQLVTVENRQVQEKLLGIASQVPNQGMFWIGLMYNTTVQQWIWQDGTTLKEGDYSNWRAGYPRLADGSNCVAYVINDDTWINTNCEKELIAICAIKKNLD